MLSFTACPDESGKSRTSGKKLEYWKYCLIIISLVLISIQIQAQYGWARITYMPTPRTGATASVVDGKIYVIGGSITGLIDVANNEMYDPSTDIWDTLAPMPTPRGFLTSAVVNGIIYVIGGGFPTATNKIESYNPLTNTWDTTLTNLPGETRLGMRAGVVNGIIYVVAGNYNQRDCYAYDPVMDTWDTLASMPIGGGGALSVTVYNGLVYTFGGSTDPIWTPVNTVYAYNPATNIWDTTLTPMPTSRFAFQTYLIGDTIYAVGGSQSQNTSLATVEAYYPITDTWDTRPNMPIDRSWFAGAVVNNKIYVIGGSTNWSNNLGEVWEYGSVVGVEEELIPPSNFILEQNYPNPFNPSTVIGYQLPISSDVTLTVYDLLGREITTLVDEYKPAGNYEVIFDSHSGNVRNLPSGVYFYQLKATPSGGQAGFFVETKKMILIK
jgi:N-acetylneuraminic acid mutarotase